MLLITYVFCYKRLHSFNKIFFFFFVREKLPRYDIDTSFMFPIDQDNCESTTTLSDDSIKLDEYIIEQQQYEEH